MTDSLTHPVELAEMLEARERRSAKHREYAQVHGCTSVVLTMNIPGEVKTSPEICRCFDDGFRSVVQMLEHSGAGLPGKETCYYTTGPEGYLAVKGDAKATKRLTVELENNHPQGRLFDIDVLDRELHPVSRSDLGIAERSCFICGESAKVCGRSRCHSLEELSAAVKEILEW